MKINFFVWLALVVFVGLALAVVMHNLGIPWGATQVLMIPLGLSFGWLTARFIE